MEMACSAVVTTLPPGVFITTTGVNDAVCDVGHGTDGVGDCSAGRGQIHSVVEPGAGNAANRTSREFPCAAGGLHTPPSEQDTAARETIDCLETGKGIFGIKDLGRIDNATISQLQLQGAGVSAETRSMAAQKITGRNTEEASCVVGHAAAPAPGEQPAAVSFFNQKQVRIAGVRVGITADKD